MPGVLKDWAMRIVMSKTGSIRRPFLCGLAVVCLLSVVCAAQRYSFREYVEGLGNLNIDCLAQDHTGYLWVGTQNGLYRYDGSQFQRFGAAEGLPERMIQNLYVGPDGTLWVGTTSGIYFEQRDGKFAEVHPPGAGRQFLQRAGTVFTSNKQDEVVTATQSGTFLLRRVDTDRWVAQPMSLEGSSILSVLYGPDGALWYGCDSDLCRLANGKTMRMRATLGLPEEQWTNLLLARNGHIWLRGQFHVGEILPGAGRFELHDLDGNLKSEAYPALAEDPEGRILTPQGSALGLWEKDHWRMVTERNGLSRFELQDLFVDREGSVWMGVVGHGLKRWVGEDRWEGYAAADGLSDDLVWASVRDHKGRLWIATESGLDWMPAGGNTPRAWRAPGIQITRAIDLEVSTDGAIWVGGTEGSLTRIDPNTLAGTQWKVPVVYDLQCDGKGHIWVATRGGLYVIDSRFPKASPQQVNDAAILHPNGRFTDLTLDPADDVWAASDQGLFRLDGKGWHRIDPGLSGSNPDVIAVDRKGNLWAAGPSQDLMRLRVSGDRIVEAEHIGRPPLLSDQVVSLIVDHRGWVWMGQDAGLTVYDGHGWRSFTQDDGLLWNDTDSYALDEDTDGSIWVGTSGGLSHLIEPQALPAGSPPAPAFAQVTYGAAPLTNGASVQWSSSPLVISLAVLSFKGTQEVGIRYRLIGEQGSEWEETHEMEVRYWHLAPGNYRFEAVALDATRDTVSPVAVLTFRIMPQWWQNRYLQVGLVLLAIMVVVLAWRRRIGQLLRQKHQLEEAVKLRTVDLEREKAELVHTREQMRHFAEHDAVTGLWNHRVIVERLQNEVERSHRDGTELSMILVDLDHFKQINDTFGHLAGDSALKAAGTIMQNMVRSYDWVGRYGGDEFLLILPGSNTTSARLRAEQLRSAVKSARVVHGDSVVPLTASLGVAAGFPSDSASMIQAADAALYRAKENGRNCAVVIEVGQHAESGVPLG
jgi:diguanylate cyclase (GGDEF)-like protein